MKTNIVTKTSLINIHIMPNPEPASPTQVRFEMLINHISLSIYALAKHLDVSQQRIYRAMKKQKGVDTDLLETISKKFPELNMDWVITGRGNMLFDANEKNLMMVQEPGEISPLTNIRVVHRHLYTSYPKGCIDNDYIRKLPFATSSVPDHGTFRDFEMPGPQMVDSHGNGIHEGDIIRGQLITPDLYTQMIQKGQTLVVITTNSVMIRMVKDITKGKIILKSWNPLYPEETIALTQIREIWLYRSLLTNRDFKYKLYE